MILNTYKPNSGIYYKPPESISLPPEAKLADRQEVMGFFEISFRTKLRLGG